MKLKIFCGIVVICAAILLLSLIVKPANLPSGKSHLAYQGYVNLDPRTNDLWGAIFYQAFSQRRGGYKRRD